MRAAPRRRARGWTDTARAVLAAAACAATASASPQNQHEQWYAPDAAAGNDFGSSVALSGDTAAVGAPDNGNGAVYVFARGASGWAHEATLTASESASFYGFGRSVAVDGDTVVGTAGGSGGGFVLSGSAYVFVRDTGGWTQQAKLTASDAGPNDFFGDSCVVDGDTVLIGAAGDFGFGTHTGKGYVYVRSGTTWSEQAILSASDAALDDAFGWSCGLDGDTALLGAILDGSQTGAAYVFVRGGTTWSEQTKLTASDGQSGDVLGWSVALAGNLVGAGARDDDGHGSAYLFERRGTVWSETARLVASDAAAGDWFGSAIAVGPDRVLVGAQESDAPLSGAGAAYAFARVGGGWSEGARLRADDTAVGDELGAGVALDGEVALVGAPRDSDAASSAGAAYLYHLAGEAGIATCFGDGSALACPCGNAGATGEGCANSTGPGARLATTGTPVVASDDLVLQLTQARPTKVGIFLQGASTISAPLRDGLLCVGNPTERLELFQLDGAGAASSSVPIVAAGQVAPGEARTYQAYFRDGGGPCGAGGNTSNAVVVSWR